MMLRGEILSMKNLDKTVKFDRLFLRGQINLVN